MSWQVKHRLDPDVIETLYQKFTAIAEDTHDDYSHQELATAAGQFIGWIVLNIDCWNCRKNTKAATTAGLKLLFRKADEEAPPTSGPPSDQHMH